MSFQVNSIAIDINIPKYGWWVSWVGKRKGISTTQALELMKPRSSIRISLCGAHAEWTRPRKPLRTHAEVVNTSTNPPRPGVHGPCRRSKRVSLAKGRKGNTKGFKIEGCSTQPFHKPLLKNSTHTVHRSPRVAGQYAQIMAVGWFNSTHPFR